MFPFLSGALSLSHPEVLDLWGSAKELNYTKIYLKLASYSKTAEIMSEISIQSETESGKVFQSDNW